MAYQQPTHPLLLTAKLALQNHGSMVARNKPLMMLYDRHL